MYSQTQNLRRVLMDYRAPEYSSPLLQSLLSVRFTVYRLLIILHSVYIMSAALTFYIYIYALRTEHEVTHSHRFQMFALSREITP